MVEPWMTREESEEQPSRVEFDGRCVSLMSESMVVSEGIDASRSNFDSPPPTSAGKLGFPERAFSAAGVAFLSAILVNPLDVAKLAKCIEIGLPELILMVVISQYLTPYVKSKRPICDRFAVLFSVAIVWVYAGILTWSDGAHKKSMDALTSCRTDRAGLVIGAPWFYFPYPFQWGAPTFTTGEAFAMMVASFAASVESTGIFIATARYGSSTPVPPFLNSDWEGNNSTISNPCNKGAGNTLTYRATYQALAKMGCLYSLASKAYKTGLKLLSNSSEEDFCVVMLISLSKIAAKSTLLISTQHKVYMPNLDFLEENDDEVDLKCHTLFLLVHCYSFSFFMLVNKFCRYYGPCETKI